MDQPVNYSERIISERLSIRYQEAADTVFMDGSTPWEVDEAMVEFGYNMGPYEAEDLIGLDVTRSASPSLQLVTRSKQHQNTNAKRCEDITPTRRIIPIASRMLELGKLGKKTGAGWYRYPGGNGKVDDPIVADLALEEAHFAGITRTDYSADEIRSRLLLAMINEAANMLDEGVAQNTAVVDRISVDACGFPPWRKGLMQYGDTIGVETIVVQLSELENEDPVAWRVSPWLKRCLANGALSQRHNHE